MNNYEHTIIARQDTSASQIKQMKKVGGVSGMLTMLPGVSKAQKAMETIGREASSEGLTKKIEKLLEK